MRISCDLCSKKFKGVSVSGLKGALGCHWAIEHHELKTVLQLDPDIRQEFVDSLYG